MHLLELLLEVRKTGSDIAMQHAKLTKEQSSLAAWSVERAYMRLESESTGIPQLEMRLWQKVLKLLPQELHYFVRDYFVDRGGWKYHQGPDHFFRSFACWVAWSQRRSLKKLRTKLPQDQHLAVSNRLKQEGAAKVFRRLRPAFEDLDYEEVTERGLLDLRIARVMESNCKDRAVFKILPTVKKAFLAAIARNDLDFFARAGDVLRKRQRSLGEWSDFRTSNLQEFLLHHWDSEKDGVPPLCTLPIKKLHEVCQEHLDQTNLTPSAVEKTRQRLGLPSFRKG